MIFKIVIVSSILLANACTTNVGVQTVSHKSFLYKITKKKENKDNVLANKDVKLKPQSKGPVVAKAPETIITKPVITVRNTANKQQIWQWPVKLQNIKMLPQKNGLDIFGLPSSEVYAARHGEVVYSGSALRGYGNLIIIKHDNNYLSAYGHNDQIFVKEGQKIQIGQKIATMGNSGTDQVKLHFEIRHNGKPIDPATILAPG